MEINDFEIIWLYTLDSGRWIKNKKELIEIGDNLTKKASIIEGTIRYHTAAELEERAGSKGKKAEFRVKNEKIKEILDMFYDSDMDNIDPEYLENLQFFRAKLTSFEITLPGDRVEPIEVRLLYHNMGIFILEFSLKIKDMGITPEIVNDLQMLPRGEDELTLKIPRNVLKDYSMINPETAALIEKGSEDKPITINFTFHEVVWIYWAIIAFIASGEKAKNSKELHRSLRYHVFHFYPVLIMHLPESPTIPDLLEKYKAELYSMISQEIYLKPEHLRLDIIEGAFASENNLADRADYALYFCQESSMLLYSQDSISTLEFIASKRKIPIERQLLFEKLDFLLVLEFIHIQQFILMMYDYLLSKKPISEMEPDDLTQMRSRLSKGVEEFHNVKLAVKTCTIKRLERGRECFKFENSLSVLENKLEMVDSAVSGIHGNLMEFLSVLLGILVAIGPIIALAIGQEYPIIASCITASVLLGIYFLYKQLYKLWYRRNKK